MFTSLAEAARPLRSQDTTSSTAPVLHAHHYNLELQRMLGASAVDVVPLFREAAMQAGFGQATAWLKKLGARSDAARLAALPALFERVGLGALDLASVSIGGGEAIVRDSHFAVGWLSKYPPPAAGVCIVTAGYLAGAITAAARTAFHVDEVDCAATGSAACRFSVVHNSPAELSAADSYPLPHTSSGAGFTWLPAAFYGAIAYGFENEIPRIRGPKYSGLGRIVLTEVGQRAAFATLGDEVRENALRPESDRRSPEEMLRSLVERINTFNWGRWELAALDPGERLSIRIYDSYEARAYRNLYPTARTAKCYLAQSFVAGMMNLLYVNGKTPAAAKPGSTYNRLFRSPLSFRAVEARCFAQDDPYCEFIANELSPGFRSLVEAVR